MFKHQDALETLNKNIPLGEKLKFIHAFLHDQFDFIDRIAIALYDEKTDLLKTYVHSSGLDIPLQHYQSTLAEAPSLQEIILLGRPRVVNDMAFLAGSGKVHSQRIGAQGYGSSYTLPMYSNGIFFGFLFFNSYRSDVFNESALHYIDLYGHLLELIVINEMAEVRALVASIKTATNMALQRDFETGYHLERMSNYARLIARDLAEKYGLTDDIVEHIFLFAPLHDIGKIGIPDHILLKPGKLSAEEYEIMQKHVGKGVEIIDAMVANFGLQEVKHIDILRNVAHYHHEAINGSGYPQGLKGEEIPPEARIVAVADVFDALTSRRSYKDAWSNDAAFDLLLELSDSKFDRDCVQ
ncbi:MAG: HD domain-containing phosphohydrolase, partial [Sulfuricella sp.]